MKSKCCRSEMKTSFGEEGTNFYVCQNCNKPCDPAIEPDMVNNPPHYTQGGIECIDIIKAMLTPEQFAGYCKGNVLKYYYREDMKGAQQDREKAGWYHAQYEKCKAEKENKNH